MILKNKQKQETTFKNTTTTTPLPPTMRIFSWKIDYYFFTKKKIYYYYNNPVNPKIPGFILQQQQQTKKFIPITIIFCLVFCNSFSYLDESNPFKKWTMCSLLNPIIIITYHYKPIILVILKKKIQIKIPLLWRNRLLFRENKKLFCNCCS